MLTNALSFANDVPVSILGAAGILVVIILYTFVVQPVLLSPLRHLPAAHPTAHLSPAWILWHRLRQTDTPAVHAAHQRLGPIVRIAPNEISVNSFDGGSGSGGGGGIRLVYGGGFEKGDWYRNAFTNYGVEPMFAMPERGRHAARKRMLSNVYAKSVLAGSACVAGITRVVVGDRLRERVRVDAETAAAAAAESEAADDGAVEFYDIFAAVTMDFVAAYVFGLAQGSDLLRQRAASTKFLREYKARQRYTFWPQECPRLTRVLSRIGLRWVVVPPWVDAANESIEAWIMEMCERAEQVVLGQLSEKDGWEKIGEEQDFPSVYVQLRNALLKEKKASPGSSLKDERLSTECNILKTSMREEIASELLDHTLAGFDTSSITLTYLAWELSRPVNRAWQLALRTELLALPADQRLDARALDSSCPILHAIVMETLRLHAPIPGQQPRETPHTTSSSPTVLGGVVIPGGVRVQAQAWSLHREPTVFPDPERWEPGRWLSTADGTTKLAGVPPEAAAFAPSADQLRVMHRWFWAFSSGGRMCVGSNLAMLDMKATVAALWNTFDTELVSTDYMMRHNGGYISEPLGDGHGRFCRLRVRELEST